MAATQRSPNGTVAVTLRGPIKEVKAHIPYILWKGVPVNIRYVTGVLLSDTDYMHEFCKDFPIAFICLFML